VNAAQSEDDVEREIVAALGAGTVAGGS